MLRYLSYFPSCRFENLSASSYAFVNFSVITDQYGIARIFSFSYVAYSSIRFIDYQSHRLIWRLTVFLQIKCQLDQVMKGQKKVKDPLILFQAQSAIYNHSDCSQLQMKTIQIAFVGSINAGKTSLVRRCLHNQFQQTTQPTIGLQFHTTTITIGAQTYKCNFIDSQGFDNNLGVIMIPQLKHFHGFIVVYDVTQDASFTNSKLCYQQILEHCQVENQNVAFVGNKIDLQRKVPYQQANEYCLQKDIYYVQTSAKNNNHIQKIIERIAKDLICSGKIKSQKNIRKKENVLTLTKKALKQNLQQGCLKRFLSKLKGLFGWIK